MKNISAIVFALVSLFATTAFAQSSEQLETNLQKVVIEGLDPALAQCIATCVAGEELPKECVPADKADVQKKASVAKRTKAKKQVRLEMTRVKISRLEMNVSGAWEEIRELKTQATKLEAELKSLREYLKYLEDYLKELEGMIQENAADIAELQDEMDNVQETVGDHEDRITDLENSKAMLAFGGRLTPLYLCSTDETCYGGLAIGPRFGMVVDGNVISVDAQAMTGFAGENPYGVRIRGGYQIGLSDLVALDTGLSGSFADLDPALDARSAFIGMELGLVLTPPGDVLSVGAAAFGGVELDQDDPAAAFGGLLTLGVDLPR